MTDQNLPITEAMRAADKARAAYAAAGYHGTDEYVDVLEQLVISVRGNLSVDQANERACGYAAGREDASGVKTVPAPDSPRGPDFGWMDYADAFAQAQDDFNQGRRGSMTNCKVAYERWTETNGRTIDDEMDERAAAIRAARDAQVADDAALARIESSACDR